MILIMLGVAVTATAMLITLGITSLIRHVDTYVDKRVREFFEINKNK